jgi:hypothetical protein
MFASDVYFSKALWIFSPPLFSELFDKPDMSSQPVLVCGFGIIGLTSAIRLLQAGYKVIAVAEHFPGDPFTAIYASTAAGAHHLSFAANDDLRQQALDKRTFDVMWEEERTEGEASALLKLRQVEYYATEGETHLNFYESMPDVCIPLNVLCMRLTLFSKVSCLFQRGTQTLRGIYSLVHLVDYGYYTISNQVGQNFQRSWRCRTS